jgi:hypothetical protein
MPLSATEMWARPPSWLARFCEELQAREGRHADTGTNRPFKHSHLMPLYYFHIEDGEPVVDPTPEELPDDDAAKVHARQIAADLARGNHLGAEWRVVAKNQSGEIIVEVPTLWNVNAALAIKR